MRPRISLAIVATDLFGLRPSVFRDGEITWRHLAASCAVFGLLPQYRLDGRRHSDGGLLGALPVWAARQLGATRIVGIHLLPRPPVALRVTRSLLRALARFAPAIEGVATMIAPAHPLGRLRDTAVWSPENARRWIELGRRDAKTAELW
jgi:predicted acylesterase/phospholipase RssA